MKSDLQILAWNIYKICISNNINIELKWLPREQNVQADYFSKIFDFDNWSVAENIFNMIQCKWGVSTIDRFADHKNRKVKKCNSQFWNPGTCGVNAFAFDWSNESNWLAPPIGLVSRVINHLCLCNAKGALAVLKWKSVLCWPMIWNDTNNCFQNFVKDSIEFCRPRNFFCRRIRQRVYSPSLHSSIMESC